MVRNLFEGIVGQDLAIDLLVRAVQQSRIAPAYLFAGSPGIGRRLTAERFAELIISTGPTSELSNARITALRRRIVERNHPDVFWVEPTYLHQGKLLTPAEAEVAGLKRKSPPQIRLEQVRQIARSLSRPPLEAQRSVVIIEGAETMAEAPANGLLKTLEEPGQATLILLAPDSDALLPTLVSRCQVIPFTRLNPAQMQQVLRQANQEAVAGHADILAMAEGSPGQAIEAYERLQTIPAELLAALEQPPRTLREALEQGREIAKTLDTEAQLWLADYLQQRYWKTNPLAGRAWLLHLEQAKKYLRSYVQPRLVWEVTLMRLLPGTTPG